MCSDMHAHTIHIITQCNEIMKLLKNIECSFSEGKN